MFIRINKYDLRVKILKRMVISVSSPDKIICDLGAGKNPISDNIKCRYRVKVDILKQLNPNIVCDISSGIPIKDESIDIIVMGEVLEHLYHSKVALREARRILNPSGYLIISVPNMCSLNARLHFLFGRLPYWCAKANYSTYSHIRDYNFYELKHSVEEHGFQIIEAKGCGVEIRNYFIQGTQFLPVNFQENIMIKCQKI